MKRCGRWLLRASLGVLLGAAPGLAQAPDPPRTVDEALQTLSAAAGVIFTGTVTAVRHQASVGAGAAPVVEVDFAVAEAVRGVSGSTFTMREWAGLWPADGQLFAPGQRYLMLLHTPNAAGLTSPVGGPDGAIPIRAAGAVAASSGTLASGSSISSSTGAMPEYVLDLRWIATRVLRPVSYQTSTARPVGGTTLLQANAVKAAQDPLPNSQSASPSLPASAGAVEYGSVMTKLRSWEANRDAAR